MKMSRVVVGPVIGRVTKSSARVLVEVDWATDSLCVELTPNVGAGPRGAAQPPQRTTLPAQAGRPVAFTFAGLSPGTKYVVTVLSLVNGVGAPLAHVASSFRTQASRGAVEAVRIGVVSCNKIYVTEKNAREDPQFADAWVALQQRVERGELDVIIHVGDQVLLYTLTPASCPPPSKP